MFTQISESNLVQYLIKLCKTAKVKKKKKDTLSSKKVKDTMQILKHIMVAVTVLRITLTLHSWN